MSKSISRKERMANKQKRDGQKKGGGFKVLDTKDYPDLEWVKLELETGYAFDIMPYLVTSKHHPEYALLKEEAEEGGFEAEDYKLDLYIHKAVGPNKKNVVCPNKTYGKPCPICEEHDRVREENDDLEWDDKKLKKLLSPLRASQKSFFIVIDQNDHGKMKLLEYSWYWFTKNLLAQAKRKSKKKEILIQDISEDGVTIVFEFDPSTFDEKMVGEVKSFDFEERVDEKNKPYGYTEEDIAEAPRLDTMVKTSTYKEISAIFFGDTSDDDDDDDDKKEDEPKPSRRSSKKVEEDDDDDEDTPPARTSRKKKSKTPECPVSGLEFGKDADTRKCQGDDCEFYDECEKLSDED